ncbi:MAG: alkaline phosphatase family protein [bacterium]
MSRLPRGLKRALALGGLVAAVLGAIGCATWPAGWRSGPVRPKLIVLLVVDQLRPDRLAAGQPDGLGRLQREGRVFEAAALDYAFSETCPGHATAASGRSPRRTGIVANRFVLEETLERVYCVLDRTEAGRLVAAGAPEALPSDPGAGRSPALLRGEAIGDWLKAAHPTARVHALSGKDRSAIALGGQRPDGVWWIDVAGSGALTTSRYYLDPAPLGSTPDPEQVSSASAASKGATTSMAPTDAASGPPSALPSLPEWAAAWTRARVLEGVPPQWIHPSHDPQGLIRDDEYPAESPWASRTSPHPLNEPLNEALNEPDPNGVPDRQAAPDRRGATGRPPEDVPRRDEAARRAAARRRVQIVRQVAASPHLDRRLLEIALDLVDAESLGSRRDGATDLLAIGLSATDLVGHLYGPFSQESRDALADLDEAIGELLAALEARLGPDGFGVVLTADHGVLPLPEWAQEVDLPENDCPVPGGRVSERALVERLRTTVASEVAAELAARGAELEDIDASRDDPWLVLDGLRLHADEARLAAAGVPASRLEAAIRKVVASEPGLARVWSREELLNGAEAEAGTEAEASARAASATEAGIAAGSEVGARGSGADPLRLESHLLRQMLAPGRSPDWIVLPERGCLVTDHPHGTSHGSPYDYDRRIPLVFWGPGVEPGVDSRPARLVDLAPTLARWIGLDPPSDLDGRALPLRSNALPLRSNAEASPRP